MTLPIRRLLPALFAALVLALLHVVPAHAQINLAWNDCITQPNAAENISYACDGSRNGTPFKAVVSFVSPIDMPGFVAMFAEVDLYMGHYPDDSPSAVLPDYWRLANGECRVGNFGYPEPLSGIGTGLTGPCQNPWKGAFSAASFIRTEMRYSTPWPGHVQILFDLALNAPTSIVGGQQYVAGVFSLDTWKDVDTGDGACAGCCEPMYLLCSLLRLNQAGYTPTQIELTAPATRSHIGWLGCMQTPIRNRTWGSIKATYR